MNNKVFISCAVTGSGDTASKHPDLPKTPEQIATASIEAAKAGAAIAHIHVREEDGTPSRRLELYKEVIDRVRSSDTDVILNLTTGMGGDLDIGQGKNPLDFGPMTDMANVMERIANAEQFLPGEIVQHLQFFPLHLPYLSWDQNLKDFYLVQCQGRPPYLLLDLILHLCHLI